MILFRFMLYIVKLLLFPLVIIALVNISDIIYSFFNPFYYFQPTIFETEKLFIWAFVISLMSYRQKIVTFIVFHFFIFFELASYSYFGRLVTPIDIWLFFSHFMEVLDGLNDEFTSLFIPTLVTAISLLFSIFILKKVDKYTLKMNYSVVLIYIMLFVSSYNMYVDIYVKNKNSVDKYPKTLSTSVRNMYNSLNYFAIVTLPRKLSSKREVTKEYKAELLMKEPKKNIILLFGESLRAKNTFLLGYGLSTMPRLKSLKKESEIDAKVCISSGTMTKVSIAYTLNQIKALDDIQKIYTGNSCLFKFAKENGFTTIFTTNQSASESRYMNSLICPKYIDVFETPKDIVGNNDTDLTLSDGNFVEKLKKIHLDKPNFIVMQSQGSHAPYSNKSPEKFKHFKSDYDNSIYYADANIANLIEYLKKQKNILPTYLIYVSDHGELLGERGKKGHGHLEEEVFEVPFVYYNTSKDEKIDNFLSKKNIITQYDISQIITYILGYKEDFNQSNSRKVMVMGRDVDGYAGYAYVKIKDGKVISKDICK